METTEESKRYVCFIKGRACDKLVPYKVKGEDCFVVDTLRGFLDYEISRYLGAEIKPALLMRVPLEEFARDLESGTANSKLVAILGWNYPKACRLVEREGSVFIMTIHPRFEAKPISVRLVCEDDEYALSFVEQLFSLRGGKIVFEEYDPEKHVTRY